MRTLVTTLAFVALSFTTLLPTAHAETPPDVVKKKDGGLLRGTIEELDPKGKVTLILPSGERRTLDMTDVEYAGPAARAPGGPPEPPPAARAAPVGGITVSTQAADVVLKADDPDITYHVRSTEGVVTTSHGSGVVLGYSRLCTAPCSAQLPVGSYTLGLSRGDRGVVEADPVTIRGPSTLEATYRSRQGTRTGGWFVVLGGGVIGALLIATSSTSRSACVSGFCTEVSEIDTTKLLLGFTTIAAATAIGVVMITRRDIATISVSPGIAGVAREGRVAGLEGLTLRATF